MRKQEGRQAKPLLPLESSAARSGAALYRVDEMLLAKS